MTLVQKKLNYFKMKINKSIYIILIFSIIIPNAYSQLDSNLEYLDTNQYWVKNYAIFQDDIWMVGGFIDENEIKNLNKNIIYKFYDSNNEELTDYQATFFKNKKPSDYFKIDEIISNKNALYLICKENDRIIFINNNKVKIYKYPFSEKYNGEIKFYEFHLDINDNLWISENASNYIGLYRFRDGIRETIDINLKMIYKFAIKDKVLIVLGENSENGDKLLIFNYKDLKLLNSFKLKNRINSYKIFVQNNNVYLLNYIGDFYVLTDYKSLNYRKIDSTLFNTPFCFWFFIFKDDIIISNIKGLIKYNLNNDHFFYLHENKRGFLIKDIKFFNNYIIGKIAYDCSDNSYFLPFPLVKLAMY